MNTTTRRALIILGENVVGQLRNSSRLSKYVSLNLLKNKLAISGSKSRQNICALNYLKSRGYIKIEKPNSSALPIVVLTGKGAMQYLKYCTFVNNYKLPKAIKTLVILTVPETERGIRDFLRRRLVENGFKMESGGIYSSIYKLNDNFSFLVHLSDISDYVKYGEFREIY